MENTCQRKKFSSAKVKTTFIHTLPYNVCSKYYYYYSNFLFRFYIYHTVSIH